MSTIRKSILKIVLASILLTACAAQPASTSIPFPSQTNNPYAPQSGDEAMMRGAAEIVSVSVEVTKTLPAPISVPLAYHLPTPCHQLRVNISQPDSQNRINLDVYGVALKDKPCALMALSTPMEASISLGSFPSGHYTVWVNGQQAGEFDI
jgi:hypothetical protein